jgi:DNA-binding transcriptional regulator PaaX
MMLEADSRGAQVDRKMVHSAWNFPRINERYQQHIEILARLPSPAKCSARLLADWSRLENQAWLGAVHRDPLLPSSLLPADYLGTKAWNKRRTVLRPALRLAAKS